MMSENHICAAAKAMAQTYTTGSVPLYGKKLRLPDRQAVILLIKDIRRLIFPAYYGEAALMSLAPEDYDVIITGDLGRLGSEILHGLLEKDGIHADVQDCGVMIFDTRRQDVHCGGSGCGCSASVLCGPLLSRMERGELRRLLFCGTGALLSPLSTQQGESIPAVCHAVVRERS